MKIRMNSVVVTPDTTGVKSVMFKNSQELDVVRTEIRTEDCGCSGMAPVDRKYYVVECLGLQFAIDSEFARVVDENDPPEEVAGRPEDMLNIKVPGLGLEGNKEERHDDEWMAASKVVFDLRGK